MPAGALFVCAHGAGGHKDDASLLASARAIEDAGVQVLRFNFPYRERGARLPDPMPRLIASFAETVRRARETLQPGKLIIGGRSMGGRVASMMAAQGFACDGLLLLAYPLHPPAPKDQPAEKLRDAHLAGIAVPVLCFNGTRDPLCRRELMERALATVKTRWEMRWIEGADHSLRGKRASEEITASVREWLATL